MAFAHIQIGYTKPNALALRGALRNFEDNYLRLQQLLASMTMMIDGDGSSAGQFNEVVVQFEFASPADAKAAWDELNSLMAKLTTDADVTSVKSALNQAFNKFR